MNIHVIGAGYVGLVSALSFAKNGHFVQCWDVNASIIERLDACEPHFFEIGLKELLVEQKRKASISFDIAKNYTIDENVDIIFIAVGTPTSTSGIDLTYIKGAFNMIGAALRASIRSTPSIVIKSTVLPGTSKTCFSEMVNKFSLEHSNIGIGMCPEFLREGSAISDALTPDRIVIGYEDNITKERLKLLFSAYDCPIIHMNTATAEFSKYCNNAYLALQISMANSLANIANSNPSICIHDALKAVHLDKRWTGSPAQIVNYLYPGCGFGGSCFPKDVKALNQFSIEQGYPSPLIDSIISVNQEQPYKSLSHIEDWLDDKSVNIGILGYSFKPDTDDIRETPALPILKYLNGEGFCNFNIHDPVVDEARIIDSFKSNARLQVFADLKDIIEASDILILVTSWKQYLSLADLQELKPTIKLFDTRSFLNASEYSVWEYRSLSRKEISLK